MKNLYSNLNYFENGDTNKDIIIFLHPKNLSSWIWNNQIDYFDDYHCFYINLNNRTIKENLELIGNLIETKIKKENITTNKNSNKPQNKINLVGIEFGGQIAIELLNKYPDIINKVFLSGVNFNNYKEIIFLLEENNEKNNEKNNKNKSNLEEYDEFNLDEIFTKTKKEYLDKKSERFLAKAYLREFGISKEYYEEMKESLDEKAIKEQYKIAKDSLNYKLNPNLKDNLNKNNFNMNNILISYGTKEDLTTQISAITLKSLLKDAKLIKIEKGLLLWNMSKSELFNTILKEFLEE